MTAKYTVIDSQVLATSAASVTFSSIPGGYKDLVLVVDAKPDVTGAKSLSYRINGDTGGNYPYVVMYGNGSAASSSVSAGASSVTFAIGGATESVGNTLGISEIMDYSATNKHKSILNRGNDTTGTYTSVDASAYRWANTSAVTSLEISLSSGNLDAGSTFRLLGVN